MECIYCIALFNRLEIFTVSTEHAQLTLVLKSFSMAHWKQLLAYSAARLIYAMQKVEHCSDNITR